jgi:phosphoglycerate dehydrogenase-like enzyme
MKVAIIDDWQGIAHEATDWTPLEQRAELTFFKQAFRDENDAAAQLADFEAVLTMRERTPLPGSLIRRLPKLRMLGITGIHNASLDLQACKDAGVVVCNTDMTGISQSAAAEMALALLLAAARTIPAGDKNIRSEKFQEDLPYGMRLDGKTIGLVGLGRLGSTMARFCLALNMKVVAWSPNLTEEKAKAGGATLVSKAELCSVSDAISIHMVLSDRTRGLIGAEEFEQMKRGTIFVNTSRGPLVDERAMLAALEAKRIVAALDVYDSEPLPKDHPLRTMPNTILTPHVGYVVEETMAEFYKQSRDNALAFAEGHPIRVVA